LAKIRAEIAKESAEIEVEKKKVQTTAVTPTSTCEVPHLTIRRHLVEQHPTRRNADDLRRGLPPTNSAWRCRPAHYCPRRAQCQRGCHNPEPSRQQAYALNTEAATKKQPGCGEFGLRRPTLKQVKRANSHRLIAQQAAAAAAATQKKRPQKAAAAAQRQSKPPEQAAQAAIRRASKSPPTIPNAANASAATKAVTDASAASAVGEPPIGIAGSTAARKSCPLVPPRA